MIGYIYKITSPSGRIYIGQTINLKSRKRDYSTNKSKTQVKIYNSINKYGWDTHTFEVIDECPTDYNKFLLNLKEIYWIDYYNSMEDGLNCTQGGCGSTGRRLSEETKKKISEAKKGSVPSNKGKIGLQKAWNKGIPQTDDVKEKLRIASTGNKNAKGAIRSDEYKNKMSECKKGKPGTRLGSIMSEETKKKISETKKRKFLETPLTT